MELPNPKVSNLTDNSKEATGRLGNSSQMKKD